MVNFVGILSAMGQPTRPTRPSIPLASINVDYGGGNYDYMWLYGSRPKSLTADLGWTCDD